MRPASLRSLATALRAQGGDAALALRLDEEAARMALSVAQGASGPSSAPRPHAALHARLCELWASEGIPTPTAIGPLYTAARRSGILATICPGEDEGARRLTMFSRWFASFPLARVTRGGRLWYHRPLSAVRSDVLLPSLIHPNVMRYVDAAARQQGCTREAVISGVIATHWDLDLSD